MNEVVCFHPCLPSIPADVGKQLQRIALRTLARQPLDLEYHPDAARLAEDVRRHIQPTTLMAVRGWINELVVGGLLPPNGTDLDLLARGIYVACDEFPASVWSAPTLREALRTWKWFPKPAEVYALLKPHADRIMAVLTGLEAIAKAPPAERAIPSRTPYQLPSVPEWIGAKPLRRGRGDHTRAGLPVQPPVRTVEQQIAALKDAG